MLLPPATPPCSFLKIKVPGAARILRKSGAVGDPDEVGDALNPGEEQGLVEGKHGATVVGTTALPTSTPAPAAERLEAAGGHMSSAEALEGLNLGEGSPEAPPAGASPHSSGPSAAATPKQGAPPGLPAGAEESAYEDSAARGNQAGVSTSSSPPAAAFDMARWGPEQASSARIPAALAKSLGSL